MPPDYRAVIDVGTNSIKLLVAKVDGLRIEPVLEESHQTRLGQGFYATHQLQLSRINHTAEAVAQFVTKAREYHASTVRVLATSAAREAKNADQLVSAVEKATGVPLEIITGEQEARLAFFGLTSDPRLSGQPLLLVEAGGGSTQFVLGHQEQPDFLQSFRIGSVRLLEHLSHSDPPTASELAVCRSFISDFLLREVATRLLAQIEHVSRSCPESPLRLVATGGTASILGCMEARLDHFDREALEAVRLPLDRVRWHVEHLWSLPLEARKQIVGLPKNRADVILTGAAIYEGVLREFNLPELQLSTRGLRFGAVLTSETNLAHSPFSS